MPHEHFGTHWRTLRLHAVFIAMVPEVKRHNKERNATRDELSRMRVALAEAVDFEDRAQLEKAWKLALRLTVRFENLHGQQRIDAEQLLKLRARLEEILLQLAVLRTSDPTEWLELTPLPANGQSPASDDADVETVRRSSAYRFAAAIVAEALHSLRLAPGDGARAGNGAASPPPA